MADRAGYHDATAEAGAAAKKANGHSASTELVTLFAPETLAGKPVPARTWLVQDWIPFGQTTALYGDGGAGKTLLAQTLLTCCATNHQWLGLPAKQCRSIGWFCEDDQDELHRRQHDINAELGVSFADLGDMRWESRVGADNILMRFDRSGGVLTDVFEALLRSALEFEAKLVAIDTAADTFGGDENSRPQVRQFIQGCLGGLARAIGGTVLLLAHPSRSGLTTDEGDGGSTAWNNSVRSRLYLSRPEAQRDEKPDKDARLLTRKKANYAGIGDTIELRWQQGVFVAERHSGIFGTIEHRAAEAAFLVALAKLTDRHINVSASRTAHNYAPTMIVRERMAGKFRKEDLAAAMRSLLDAGRLIVEPYGRPSDQHFRLAVATRNGDVPHASLPPANH